MDTKSQRIFDNFQYICRSVLRKLIIYFQKQLKKLVLFNLEKRNTIVGVCVQSCLTLSETMNYSCQSPVQLGFSRQEYWSEFPFPPLGDFSKPGIEPTLLASPVLAGRFFTNVPPRKPGIFKHNIIALIGTIEPIIIKLKYLNKFP